MSALSDLCIECTSCVRCGLAKGRTRVVPGEGPEDAELLFIGEGPGYNEDQQGRPFVGPAGQLLEELLASIGLARTQVYICNVVKCRPPLNRDPFPAEIAACAPWLDRQIELIQPKVIVTLGRYSLARYAPGMPISKAHGTTLRRDGRLVLPLYHPAAALHQASLRPLIQEDFKKIPALLEEARARPASPAEAPADPPAPPSEPPVDTPPAGQLSLF